ncbi:MAG: hypothetical protein P1V20_17150 [Verrucomicrobiales bacterium]|nr:hypothetical protein [Verrucomicrobiales bacterium]
MKPPENSPSLMLLRYWPVFAVLAGMYFLHSGWAAILLYHAGIIAAMLATRPPWKVTFTGFRAGPAVLLWVGGLLAAPAVAFLLPLLLGLSEEETRLALLDGLAKTGLTGHSFLLFTVYLCLPHPALEEIGWREILFVDKKTPSLRDFEFAFYHLLVMHYFFPFAWGFFVCCLFSLASMGWIWRLMKMKFGGLSVPIWFHAGGDLGAMLGLWWIIN